MRPRSPQGAVVPQAHEKARRSKGRGKHALQGAALQRRRRRVHRCARCRSRELDRQRKALREQGGGAQGTQQERRGHCGLHHRPRAGSELPSSPHAARRAVPRHRAVPRGHCGLRRGAEARSGEPGCGVRARARQAGAQARVRTQCLQDPRRPA
eukprot:Amastigsp_a512819_15.p3 type:complete len:154 gc:universal Amastigsp_a512819_15:711-250(-)